MKKNIVLIFAIIIGISSIKAQRTTKEEINHSKYGKATVESYYTKNGFLLQKVTYTNDTIFTKGNKELGEIIIYNENGKLHSKGKFLKPNKKNFLGGSPSREKNGKWTFFNEAGKLNGIINYKDNIENGVYTYYHENGKISHEGKFLKGQNTGIAKVFFNNGQLHKSVEYKEGRIFNILSFFDKDGNKIHHGTLKESNGTLKNYDLKTGEFNKTYTLENGVLNEIETKVLKTTKGNIIEKRYKNRDGSTKKIVRELNNELEGLQEFYSYKGKLKKTKNYSGGIKNGIHTVYNDDGTLFWQDTYLDGKKTGPFKSTPEGFKDEYYVLDEGTYDNEEKLTGQFTRYLQDKKEVVTLGKMGASRIVIQSGTYENGNKTGVWKTFDESGKLIKKVNFSDKENDLYVKKEYFKNSKNLKSIVEYDNLKDEGTKKHYYPNGQIKLSATYKKEKLDGEYKEYYENGQLKTIGQKKHRKKIGDWKKYNETGLIISDYIYDGHCCFPSKRIDYYYHNKGKLSSIIIQEDSKKNPLNESESYYGTSISKDYYENGQLRELESKKKKKYQSYGMKDGLYQLYNSTGALEVDGYYKDDKKDSIWAYYNYEGKLRDKTTYVSGDKLGPYEEYKYYTDDKKSKITIGVNYKNKSTHTTTYYYENGKTKGKGNYLNNSKEGEWKYYHENGKVKKEGVYEKGEEIGVWKQYNEKGRVTKRTRHN